MNVATSGRQFCIKRFLRKCCISALQAWGVSLCLRTCAAVLAVSKCEIVHSRTKDTGHDELTAARHGFFGVLPNPAINISFSAETTATLLLSAHNRIALKCEMPTTKHDEKWSCSFYVSFAWFKVGTHFCFRPDKMR